MRIAVSPAAPETFALRREWRPGDTVTLDFDMRCRRIEGPRGVNRAGDGRTAVAGGPVVLTREERHDPNFDEPVDIQAASDGTIPARRIPPPPGSHIAFAIPVRTGGTIPMTDYASADCWAGSRIRTWQKSK